MRRKFSHSKGLKKRGSFLWIHSASGEFEYAKPVIRELKKKFSYPILVTYFSPSYRKAIENFKGVDVSLPLPLDFPNSMSSLISELKPMILLIARTDLWPEMLYQCRRKNIPCFLFSATCSSPSSPPSSFLSSPFNYFKSWFLPLIKIYHFWIYSFLDGIFCVSKKDQKNFQKRGVPVEKILIIGDTRFDQVRERLEHSNFLQIESERQKKTNSEVPLLVAGSTWKEDEEILMEACSSFLRNHKLKLMIAPHEPHTQSLEALIKRIKTFKLEYVKYSELNQLENHLKLSVGNFSGLDHLNSIFLSLWDGKKILILDKLGILSEIYLLSNLSFIGGSFRRSVHSVMEPLAGGSLVLVGPHHKNNREALDFQKIDLNDKDHLSYQNDPTGLKGNLSLKRGGSSLEHLTTTPLKMVNPVQSAEEMHLFLEVYIQKYSFKRYLFHRKQIFSEVKKRRGASLRLVLELNKILSLKR